MATTPKGTLTRASRRPLSSVRSSWTTPTGSGKRRQVLQGAGHGLDAAAVQKEAVEQALLGALGAGGFHVAPVRRHDVPPHGRAGRPPWRPAPHCAAPRSSGRAPCSRPSRSPRRGAPLPAAFPRPCILLLSSVARLRRPFGTLSASAGAVRGRRRRAPASHSNTISSSRWTSGRVARGASRRLRSMASRVWTAGKLHLGRLRTPPCRARTGGLPRP